MRHLFIAALVIAFGAGSISAQTAALILGSEEYDGLADLRRGDEVTDATNRLVAAGFEVVAETDADANTLTRTVAEFGQMTTRAERLLVVLSGRFVHSKTETYFLATDTGPLPLAELPGNSLPLSTITAFLAATPGNAILAIATDDQQGPFGPHLTFGPGTFDLPQGVTLLTSEPRTMARFLSGPFARPGRKLVEIAAEAGIETGGFLSSGQIFIPEARNTAPTPSKTSEDERLRDIVDWRTADRIDTAGAYRDYLDTHPNGQFAIMAQNRIDAMTDTPEARAERGEQALDLSREARQDIQRDLSLLGYNTRGIDGIFGKGTRTAISGWQRVNGHDETGYLSSEQIEKLDEQAARRAGELEAEAEERRATELARDAEYWQETGAAGDEDGLRAYLERYPDGEYAEDARAQLNDIMADKRGEATARDRQLWDEARSEDTVQAYQDYLFLSPDGAFRDEARDRIAEFQRQSQPQSSQAEREEAALNLTPRTRRIIESRLADLGHRPGNVDGVFDQNTRRAIRRYQRARDLPETGYLNEAVVVQILADSVRSIFR